MRISDWSSDVCSSDLARTWRNAARTALFVRPIFPRSSGFLSCRGSLLAPHASRGRTTKLDRYDLSEHIGGRRRNLLHGIGLRRVAPRRTPPDVAQYARSEEQTSETQSLMSITYAVFCLKKKK